MTEFILPTLIGLVLVAYGWIFKTIIDRIKKNENNCTDLNDKLDLEMKELRENNTIVFTELKTRLASVDANLEWIKKGIAKK